MKIKKNANIKAKKGENLMKEYLSTVSSAAIPPKFKDLRDKVSELSN